MAAETLTIPNFEVYKSVSIARDLANQASEIEESLARLTPDERAQALLQRNRYLVGILEMRSSILEVIPEYFGSNFREMDIVVDTVGRDYEAEHAFNRNKTVILVNAGLSSDVYNVRLDELAAARGTTSTDIRRIIGKADHKIGEESPEYMERVVQEMLAAQKHKSENPEDTIKVDRVSWDLALRLIEMRKARADAPLRIGMYARPTSNPDEPERNLVFAYGDYLFNGLGAENHIRSAVFDLLPGDQQHARINSQAIIDKSGRLSMERVALVQSQPYFEAKIKADGDEEGRWRRSIAPTDFDFWVLTNEDSGALSVYQNLPQNPS